jgi:hypothetical protein
MNRQADLKRRRQMAASGAMPASLAGEFTLGENAALCIIATSAGSRLDERLSSGPRELKTARLFECPP